MPAQDQELNYNYNQISFALRADVSTIVGNKYAGSTFLTVAPSYGMSTLTIFFETEKSGSFEIVSNSTQEVVAKFTFNYTSDAESKEVELSNVVLVSSLINDLTFYSARTGSDNMLNIEIAVPNDYGTYNRASFGIDLTNPL